MPVYQVEVDTRRLEAIIRNAGPRAREALRNVAFTVETLAKRRAPVDTGALRASIYTVMKEGKRLPEVPGEPRRTRIPTPDGELVAHVGPSVDYGVYQEFGTRYMTAQPYLLPALEEAAETVPDEFRRVVD